MILVSSSFTNDGMRRSYSPYLLFIISLFCSAFQAPEIKKNQVIYRSTLISFYPGGYEFSLDELKEAFVSFKSIPLDGPIKHIVVEAQDNQIKINYLKDKLKVPYKVVDHRFSLKKEVDSLIDKWENQKRNQALRN